MTATVDRPRTPAPQEPARRPDRYATRRTLQAFVAAALGVVPLKALFSDNAWLLDVWLTMFIVAAPAALIRLRRPAGALDVWPGIILLVPWLTARFVGAHAYLGVIPSVTTWHDVAALMGDLHRTSREEVAPIHTTVAVRLVVCALLGLLAALIDLIAVVGRRGALAGVPLLVVFTVAGAVPRKSVEWLLFAVAAVGYLLLLALDAGDDLDSWGRRVRAPGAGRRRSVRAVSTQRIAVTAIVIAVLVPLVIPDQSRNLLSDAFHSGKGNGIGGLGGNDGTSGGITPFAALAGQLNRPAPISIAKVHVEGSARLFNLRLNVLSEYTDKGWQVDSHGDTEQLDRTSFTPADPTDVQTRSLTARVTITGLTGNAPVFAVPTSIDGLDAGTTWSPQDQILLGSKVDRGVTYTEQFDEANPSIAALDAATDATQDTSLDLNRYLQGATGLPSYVNTLVAGLIKGKTTPYAKALAIFQYFTAADSGFTYNLKVPDGQSGSQLVNFLKSQQGFCQQYAAAMGIMLRRAGVPARVVLGYEHADPDSQGNFEVTTNDAHAWVEAYFGGLGWIPFDPTPIAGLSGTADSDLSWARHGGFASTSPSGGATTSGAAPANPNKPGLGDTAEPTQAASAPTSSASFPLGGLVVGIGAIVLVVLVLAPAFVRWTRRRRRYAAIRRNADADALWSELSDTATDLGYVWSSARSPRQVATWLGKDAPDSAGSLRDIALAVEQRRYSPDGAASGGTRSGVSGDALAGELRSVSHELREFHSNRVRLRAVFWPASLGWGRWGRGGSRRGRRER